MTSSRDQLRQLGSAGNFGALQEAGRQRFAASRGDAIALMDLGAVYQEFGFLSLARECYARAAELLSDNPSPYMNLANVALEAGNYPQVRSRYQDILQRWPDQAIPYRNALNCSNFDPSPDEEARVAAARSWGQKALGRTNGARPRPAISSSAGRRLRIGYVSADFCGHTVGLLLLNVLQAHDPARVHVFAYAHLRQDDWVTAGVRQATEFVDITPLDHQGLAERIRHDAIDVLVDLSGHTAGSRLLSFVYRPAPVMVSWLGYYATTGLSLLDAVLLDESHAPAGAESQFVESVIRLSQRLCFAPVPFAPAVAPGPCQANGYITFGSFNNTAKYHPALFSQWARVLRAVPGSRLVLKWRTFNDEALCSQVVAEFGRHGIAAERIELRGPSFHADLLAEYRDIDIALDPFPFCGCLTSCEALWMGVPVVTWPQARVVSRQTHAILNAIGLAGLSARDADEYVRIAAGLAHDQVRLAELRTSLRRLMQASPLCDVAGFTRMLENTLLNLHEEIALKSAAASSPAKILLNVGAGHPRSGAVLPRVFQSPAWRECRLDVDPANEPDIIGSLLDMSSVADASIDAIYTSHTIEHLYPNEIPQAVSEFLRVLKPEGFAIITCPDLQSAAAMIAEDKLMDEAYASPAGPVTPFDILYSHRRFTSRDNPWMSHHCGFTLKVLIGTLRSNGFPSVAGKRRLAAFDLWVLAAKSQLEDKTLREMAAQLLPD